jgi:hypothetical protein
LLSVVLRCHDEIHLINQSPIFLRGRYHFLRFATCRFIWLLLRWAGFSPPSFCAAATSFICVIDRCHRLFRWLLYVLTWFCPPLIFTARYFLASTNCCCCRHSQDCLLTPMSMLLPQFIVVLSSIHCQLPILVVVVLCRRVVTPLLNNSKFHNALTYWFDLIYSTACVLSRATIFVCYLACLMTQSVLLIGRLVAPAIEGPGTWTSIIINVTNISDAVAGTARTGTTHTGTISKEHDRRRCDCDRFNHYLATLPSLQHHY